MYVLEVIPLSRTAPPEPLSYRSGTKLAIGTIVSVPLRRQVLPGLVVDCVPVREAKYALKNATYTLSKSTDMVRGKLPVELISAAEEIATYHATSTGAVLSALLLPVLPQTFEELPAFANANAGLDSATHRIEAPFITRRETYEKQIQTALEGGMGATLLVVPTQTEAEEWAGFLKKYGPVVLSGKVTGKRREAALAAAPLCKSVIIATPGFAWVPISHLAGILIERTSAGSYQLPKRPHLDVRYALATLARHRHIPLTYGDFPLPLEYRAVPDAPLTIEMPKQASTNQPPAIKIDLYDARPPKKLVGDSTSKKEEREPWQAVPEAVRRNIKKVLTAGGRVAVLAVRRGYSPTVVCRDCGTTVTDEHGNTLSLATLGGKRVFRSTDGTVSTDENMFCKVCGGWNLQPLGIGVGRIEEELRAAFPDAPIIRIDQDTRTALSLRKARQEISVPGTIILGTEIMLPLISPYEPVELGIIASADSLLALPFWRSRERFVRLGLMLAERSQHSVIVTRRSEDTALSALTSLTHPQESAVSTPPESFWKEETGLRKILSYPPFGTLIVFSIEGTSARLEEARAAIRTACLPYVPFEPAAKAISSTQSRTTLVLQLKDGIWPDAALSARIATLSPAIRLHIDSESLW